MRLLAGLLLFGPPLAAQQAQQPPRLRNPAITQVPAPPAGRFNPKAQQPPQQNPRPSIQITFDRNPVRVGEDSVVTLEPPDVVSRSPFVFGVAFSDGTRTEVERGKARVVHAYHVAGSYSVSVSVSPVPGSEVASFTPAPVVSNNDASISVVDIRLDVSSTTPTTDQPVSFTTQFQSSDSNTRYRFTFDDGTSSNWLTAPETTHAFRTPRNYPNNYVEVGRSSSGLPSSDVSIVARSAFVPIQVAAAAQPPAPPPTPAPAGPTPDRRRVPADNRDWLVYVVVALAALAIVGYSAKHWLSSPRLTLEAHQDNGARNEIADRHPLGIDVEIRLHRDVVGGEIRSGPGEATLVTAIRRTRG